jgi:aromatic ring-opening dioxygenase catalytic subunit (LigB family)
MLSYPDTNKPVVQLSLIFSLDPGAHIKMGKLSLEPLRSQGVLICASGMSFHNMQVFMSSMNNSSSRSDLKSVEFDKQYQRSSRYSGKRRRKGEYVV